MTRFLKKAALVVAAATIAGNAFADKPVRLAPVEAQEGEAPRLEPGTFLDLDGEIRSFAPTYREWFGIRRGKPRYGLAVLENAGVLAIGLTYYWVRADVNREDWDLPSIRQRLTFDAWRYDNNSNLFNHILHPFGGANFYGVSRINNLSVLESAAYTAAASFFWEFALEWRELVSINDLIFTPISGIAVGEFVFQLGEYVTSTPRNKPWHSAGAYSFGLYRKLHDPFYKNAPRPSLPHDALGYSSAYWHRFYVAGESIAVGSRDVVDGLVGIRASAELITIPGFGRPGAFAQTFTNGAFTKGSLDIGLGPNTNFDTDLFFSANVYGRYKQDYSLPTSDNAMSGSASLVALNTSFRFSDHAFSDRSDQVAIVHAAGPLLRVWQQRGRFRSSLEVSSTVDFGAIRSLAFEEWRKDRDVSGVKSVLIDKNYQFHFGASGRVQGELDYGPVGASLSAGFGIYSSLEGYDRKQELVTDDVGGSEQVIEYGGDVHLRYPGRAWLVGLRMDRFGRASRIEDFHFRRWDTRFTASLGAEF